ncbi:hypothetical protein BD311DRAFT_739483 [Dichomitus squalens]|uniref:Uncharacterized protein n=1 Tax=Dichomitus squalens TaxID=114155 RepID=A0A4Q9MMP5_9APHY|nr:hypothetical protein BD311DRAFT_739483 [Dichomitus squalens]
MSELELTEIDVAINLLLLKEILPLTPEETRGIGLYIEDCIQKVALNQNLPEKFILAIFVAKLLDKELIPPQYAALADLDLPRAVEGLLECLASPCKSTDGLPQTVAPTDVIRHRVVKDGGSVDDSRERFGRRFEKGGIRDSARIASNRRCQSGGAPHTQIAILCTRFPQPNLG